MQTQTQIHTSRKSSPINKLLIVLLAGFLAGAGCAVKVRPGAANVVDSQMYDGLITAQAAIESAKREIGRVPEIKPELNKTIALYNTAMKAYLEYHELAKAGNASSDLTQQVLAQVRAVVAAAAVVIQKVKNPSQTIKPIVWFGPTVPAVVLHGGVA